jgi:uncharacterized protein (TIGR03084 family)
MISQALDCQAESDALHHLLEPLPDADFDRVTRFKGWTVNEILQHLHFFNHAAELSLDDEDGFAELLAELRAATKRGEGMVAYTDRRLDGIKGHALLALWQESYAAMAGKFRESDPKRRVKWFGPEMSVLSSITARLMETWSHAQAVYDLLGVDRADQDRIRNIVIMGNNTFGWTFVNRGEEVPADRPYLKLTAPSGAVWEFNEPSSTNYVEGAASDFCQVVTQTRNVGDTCLTVVGAAATRWMAVAQCFAGPPQDPPAAGTRFKQA